ncbi:flippase-like domain-containing protein [bacterium]|nr:flippase-like domain-containing protein [bacterium]
MSVISADIRHWVIWTGKLLLAVLLLFLLLQNLQTGSLRATLASMQSVWLYTALLLLLPNLYFQYSKWKLLLHSVYPAVAARDIRASLLLGFTFGVVTPARIGEFGARAASIRGASRLTVVGLTAIDKMATLCVTLTVGGVGLLLFNVQHPFMPTWLLAVIEGALLAGAVLLWLLWARHSSDTSEAETRGRIVRKWQRLRSSLQHLDTRTLRRLLLLSVLFYCTFVLQFYFLLMALGPVDATTALSGISTIMLLKTLIPPLTLGELGIREGASVFVLGAAGVVAAAAIGASLLLFTINILLPGFAGLLVLLRRPLRTVA